MVSLAYSDRFNEFHLGLPKSEMSPMGDRIHRIFIEIGRPNILLIFAEVGPPFRECYEI
jgi:hypothetical protein